MISNSVIAGILIAITACFFIPFALLTWLLVFRRAKRIIYMLIFGIIARAVTIFAQSFVVFTFDNIKGYDNLPYILRLTISDVIAGVLCIALLCILFAFIKSEGLNFNRAFTIAVGFGSVEAVAGTGISYYIMLVNAFEIRTQGVTDKFHEGQGAALFEKITSQSFMSGIAVALTVTTSILACAMAAQLILYGMVNNKEKLLACIAFAVMFISKFGTDVAGHYAGDAVTVIFDIIYIVIVVYALLRILKMEKSMVIKPRSMLLKEQAEREEKKVIRIES